MFALNRGSGVSNKKVRKEWHPSKKVLNFAIVAMLDKWCMPVFTRFKQPFFAAMRYWTHCCHTLVTIDVEVLVLEVGWLLVLAMVLLDVKWGGDHGVRWTQGGSDAVPKILNIVTLIPYDKIYLVCIRYIPDT